MHTPRTPHPHTITVACFVWCACRLGSKQKALQVAERELEQQRKQHHVAMDKLLLQIQGLEQALKTERHVVTEERWVHSGCNESGGKEPSPGELHQGVRRQTQMGFVTSYFLGGF